MAFLILGHIDTHHHVLIIKQCFGQRTSQLGLAHAGGSQEYEGAYRAFAVAKSCAVSAYGIGYNVDGFVLSHHPFVHLRFQAQ